MLEILGEQLKTEEVQKILKNETFDLLFIEAWVRPALIFTHLYKGIPTIAISTFGGWWDTYEQIGAASHPLLYPQSLAQRLNNRTTWDKLIELYNYWDHLSVFQKHEDVENRKLRKLFPDMPDVKELYKNIDMLFLNLHPIWDGNRPVPPSVIYTYGIHITRPHQKLPKDLETYLNTSTYGVIYVSFGTNVKPSTVPAEKVQALINVFSQMPHNILWKWDQDVLPGKTSYIEIFKWLPQPDVLKHPSVKLFVTQCGLQSTDEAIAAGVPLVGIPMLGDQWYNAEKYVQLKIGRTVDMETLDENKLKAAIDAVLNDDSYRNNIISLRSLMADQPESGLERAVWWTEHLLRHGSGRHLRAPSANLTWREYLELDIVVPLLVIALLIVMIAIAILYFIVKNISSRLFLLNGTSDKLKCS